MRYLVAKDKRRRVAFAKSELTQTVFKVLKKNSYFSDSLTQSRLKAYYWSGQVDRFYSRIRNRCVITGRSGWVITKFKLSRLQTREMFSKGYLYGFRRSSW